MSCLLGELKHIVIKGTACKILKLLVVFVVLTGFRGIQDVLKQ